MKQVSFDKANRFVNSDKCIAYEFPLNDHDINGALVELDGRYLEKGYAVNRVCKELVYVVSGQGKLVIKDQSEVSIAKKDVLLIEPGEEYFWEGKLTMFIPCTPAWYPEQHQMLE